MKKYIIAVVLISFLIPIAAFGATKAVKIGEVVNIDRMGPRDDKILVLRIDDPENSFVSIYITQVIAGSWTAISDPSNTSIACRLTKPVPIDDKGNRIINKNHNKDIGHFRKSIGSKIMKIARWYDTEKDVLVYVVYTTKILDGSSKHSLSVVPLGMPLSP
ncbi:MAG TPA: CreA family protein [Candidatus Glassbacteria bacterium]|nr:CreA family protein [Candidatus Glassbacteria bacterium]